MGSNERASSPCAPMFLAPVWRGKHRPVFQGQGDYTHSGRRIKAIEGERGADAPARLQSPCHLVPVAVKCRFALARGGRRFDTKGCAMVGTKSRRWTAAVCVALAGCVGLGDAPPRATDVPQPLSRLRSQPAGEKPTPDLRIPSDTVAQASDIPLVP